MNRFLLAFNIVLVLALAYLYYAFYTKPVTAQVIKKTNDTSLNKIKLAYFDMDTLEKYYDYFKQTRNYLQRKNEEAESKLNKIKNDYAAKVNDYKQRGAKMSQTEQSQMQDDLQRMDQYYGQQQQTLNQDFQTEYMQKMLAVKNKVQDFLKKYSLQKGYAYVFATSSDDNVIYYKDSVRNITADILVKLNDAYKNEQKK